jgi:hypothetical protein
MLDRQSRPGQPEIIYCADGNARFAEIAIEAGFTYGAQLPRTVYFDPAFVDQKWRNPNRAKYMAALAQYRPRIATVLDWERQGQLSEVLEWAEEAAQFTETVVIIPKVWGGIARLPRQIGGKPVRLGYSVPTGFAGTSVTLWEFMGWPVHLLGGSPLTQYQLSQYCGLNVVSVDCNYHQKIATRYNQFFEPIRVNYARNKNWPTLREANGGRKWGDGSATADAPYEAFRRSCENIMKMWRGKTDERD